MKKFGKTALKPQMLYKQMFFWCLLWNQLNHFWDNNVITKWFWRLILEKPETFFKKRLIILKYVFWYIMPDNQPQIMQSNPNTPTIIYKPSEILGIIASYFSQQDVNKHVIFLQGIHLWDYENRFGILGGFSKYVRGCGTYRPLSMIFAWFLADVGKNGYICGGIMVFSCR